MKKTIRSLAPAFLAALLIAPTQAPQFARADPARSPAGLSTHATHSSAAPPFTLLLAGGSGPTDVNISLSADGRTYVIRANGPLEVGSPACVVPPVDKTELICQATAINGFEINGGNDVDNEVIGKTVPVPATLRGGSSNDILVGGGSADTLIGGPGDDRLYGGRGNDRLLGGVGADQLFGGRGHDICDGGPGLDTVRSCEVQKQIP
jgi:hypothetical protein